MTMRTMDYDAIKKSLPYRYPILLLDRARIESETRAVGFKLLSFNDLVFQGHFPHHPIMPGVLQVEAMVQTSVLLLKERLDPSSARDIYVKSIDKVKFRKPALPGDRLIVEIDIKEINGEDASVVAVNRTKSGVTCQVGMVISVRDRQTAGRIPLEFNEVDRDENIEMDVVGIMDVIPHRYPFLLIDYIASVDDSDVVAVKNITATEPYLHAYSPEYSVLPGPIQVEIIAQAGCVHTLLRPENKGKIAYFMSIFDVSYHAPVRPGDQLEIRVTIPRGGSKFGKGTGRIFVDGKLVTEGGIAFVLVDE
ncbi:MAG: 3-hydroxyacyl-ACP dehydratase FabZ [Kiritimatiellaeota bacterium]|nr:3-hydroxyacyl-ACP dehydratase FabZ [Kiritimatiellota bacterium]